MNINDSYSLLYNFLDRSVNFEKSSIYSILIRFIILGIKREKIKKIYIFVNVILDIQLIIRNYISFS